jgi:hypothetical protein
LAEPPPAQQPASEVRATGLTRRHQRSPPLNQISKVIYRLLHMKINGPRQLVDPAGRRVKTVCCGPRGRLGSRCENLQRPLTNFRQILIALRRREPKRVCVVASVQDTARQEPGGISPNASTVLRRPPRPRRRLRRPDSPPARQRHRRLRRLTFPPQIASFGRMEGYSVMHDVRALLDELTRSRMGLRRQRLIRYRESPRGCRIESPVFVEEVTAPRARRDHDHGR